MKSETIKITGMSCNHCVKSVVAEIKKLPLDKFKADINLLGVEYDETKVSHADIVKAIENAGYEVENANVEIN
ncbi:MAG: heavy-metal-associated domain-containing protein [Ignavibacteria bacterium]